MLALALAQAATPAPPPPVADDVLVVARKMRMIQVDLKAPKRDGVLVLARCRVTRSSNDAELDAVPCQAAQTCVDSRLTSRKALEACVAERSQPLLDAIVARRRAASKSAS